MKVYISGRITGLPPDQAKAIFNKAERYLINLDVSVVNPMKLPHKHEQEWIDYMIEDIQAMKDCQAIALLQNWKESEGAKIEFAIAQKMGMTIMYLPF